MGVHFSSVHAALVHRISSPGSSPNPELDPGKLSVRGCAVPAKSNPIMKPISIVNREIVNGVAKLC